MSDRDLITHIREDQRRRWEAGERRPVEAYLVEHPALAVEEEVVLDLIYSEALLREELGERANPAEYARRFPGYAARLARQFEIHRLVVGTGSSLSDETLAGEATPAEGTDRRPDLPGYQLGRKLGEGSWGVVYEAVQIALARPVAVKLARAGAVSVLREAAAVVQLDSPHVVRVYDAGECGGRAYYAMELVDGGSLADRRGPVPPPEAARLVLGAARGVAAAHARGIVHRDLKPANVLLARDGTPKVADFGLARLPGAAASLVQSGATVGTEGYMAPEQVGAAKGARPTADVYALGAILHELLTGRVPFKGADFADTIVRLRTQPTPTVRGLPRDLDTVRRKCLEKRPADRYPSAGELAADLERFLAGRPVQARRRPWPVRLWGRGRAQPWPALTLLALVVGVVIGAIAWRWGEQPERNSPDPAVIHAERARALREEFTSRGQVTLVPDRGPPTTHAAVAGAESAATEVGADGTFRVQSRQLTLVELLPELGASAYRVSVEVREDGCHGEGEVGVYFACGRVPTERGEGFLFGRLSFADLGPRARSVPGAGGTLGSQAAVGYQFFLPPGPPAVKDGWATGRGQSTPYQPPPEEQVTWRTLVVEVTPPAARATFDGAAVPPLSHLYVDLWLRTLPQSTKSLEGRAVSRQPDGGVGLFVNNCRASFRNCRVESLKAPEDP